MTARSARPVGRPASATLRQAFPAVADQLVDQSLGDTLAKGSSARVQWQCPAGHRWYAVVYNRTNAKNPTGCPVCDGKLIQAGVNDLATLRPDVAALLVDQSLAATLAQFSNKKVEFRCPVHSAHRWTAPLSRLTKQGSGCPYCSGRRATPGVNDLKTTHPLLAAQLEDPALAAELTAGSSRKVPWTCPEHPDQTWEQTPYQRTAHGTDCPVCADRVVIAGVNDLATTHPGLTAQLVDPAQALEVTCRTDRPLTWFCPENEDHTWTTGVHNRVRGSGCPVCANRTVIPGDNDLATTHPEIAAELVDPSQATTVTAGSGTKLRWQCVDDPEHTYKASVSHITSPCRTFCPQCSRRGPSRSEQRLAQIISGLVSPDEVLTSDQSVLPGRQELDIVVPSRRLAIEFNGVYWHSESAGKSAGFHRAKTEAAREAGYQLLHVWEDDWIQRPDAVIRSIAHKLHARDRLPQILNAPHRHDAERTQARKLICTQVSGARARAFLEHHHIQGAVTATAHLALVDANDEIRALLSVRSPRSNARMHRAAGQWEIQRYATSGVVPGGFTRLLAFAERHAAEENLELTSWISFSAADVSDGGLYRAAGFAADGQLPPDYRYVGEATGWTRTPKERFQKRRFRTDPALLWDESWTEREAAAANGLHRVYDAGKTRWVKPVVR